MYYHNNLSYSFSFIQINAIGALTLVGIFMPAYHLHCARYIKDDANFINGENVPRLMEILTDGITKCCKNANTDECVSELLLDHFDCIVEINVHIQMTEMMQYIMIFQ